MQPLFKWPGGKRKIVREIHNAFGGGECPGLYREPYLGGGAALLHLLDIGAVRDAYAYDIDQDLMRLWIYIQDRPTLLIEDLAGLPQEVPTREEYEAIRATFNIQRKPALMLWLLATCFNGVWRRNKAGLMNTPKGTGKAAYTADMIHKFSAELMDVYFCPPAMWEVAPEDWVYLDPPYPGTKGTYGHRYAPTFRMEAQEYADTGARVVVSLPPGPEADSFTDWHRIEVPHRYTVSRSSDRPPVVEVLLASVDPRGIA